VPLKHVALAVKGEIMIVRVDIDRELIIADTFKSVSFAAWMFQVAQVDAVIEGLPNVRFAFAIERTVTHDERALIESQNPTVPPGKGPRAPNNTRGRVPAPRQIAARPEEWANGAPSLSVAKSAAHVPPHAVVSVTSSAPPGLLQSPANTVVEGQTNVKVAAGMAPGGPVAPRPLLSKIGPPPSASQSQLPVAPDTSAIQKSALASIGSPMAPAGIGAKVGRPALEKLSKAASTKSTGTPDAHRSGTPPRIGSKELRRAPDGIGRHAGSSADRRSIVMEGNGVPGGFSSSTGLRQKSPSGGATVRVSNGLGGQGDAGAAKPTANSHLALWTGRDPSDPYEPFFVTEDPGYFAAANRSYVVRSTSDATTRYHHLRVRVVPGASLGNDFAEGPDLESPQIREDTTVLVLPAKRARDTGNEEEEDSNGATVGADRIEVCEKGYISAVKAASVYNSALRENRRDLEQWYVEDSLVIKVGEVRETAVGGDESSSSE
jgi:hypothetical protein